MGRNRTSQDWGPWALVAGVALVAAAAISRGMVRRLRREDRLHRED